VRKLFTKMEYENRNGSLQRFLLKQINFLISN
jgi:hypothetical protein